MQKLIILISAAFMGSCSNSPKGSPSGILGNKPVKEMAIDDSGARTIKVPITPNDFEMNVETIFDSVSYVRLSNVPEATLGGINQLIIKDSLLIIRDCYSTKSVKLFSMSGEFIRNIGTYGRGPGEYMQPTHMQITPDNKVVIWDQYMQKLSYYDLSGKFLQAKDVPFFCMKFYLFGNGRYLFNTLNSDNDKMKSIVDYTIFECDDTMEPTYTGFYRKKDTYESLLSDHNFFDRDSVVYYHPPYCDSIYSIHPDRTIRAEFAFDFGRKTVPEKLRKGKHRKELRKEQALEKFSFMSGDFHLTDHHIHFGYVKGHRQFNCIYDLAAGEFYGFHSRTGFFPVPFLNIVASTDNAFIGYFFPAMVKPGIAGWDRKYYDVLVKQFGKAQVDLGFAMQNEDNPIITFHYLKR